jgi:hypothetical protein
MSTVVPLRPGLEPYPDGEPNPEVIQHLSGLLDRAKAGEIIGIAYAAIHPGDFTSYTRKGRTTRGVIGALVMLQHDMCKADIEAD